MRPSGFPRFDFDLITDPKAAIRDVKEVLVVDPDPEMRRAAHQGLKAIAVVSTCSRFRDARARLQTNPPSLLVTKVRLEAHNGLHLVHLAPPQTRCVVYATDVDLALARDAQEAGAFFVHVTGLTLALQSLATAALPHRDRRDPMVLDRRRSFRGGRRCTDL